MPENTGRSPVDTYVQSTKASANFGASRRLAIGVGSATWYSYIYFTRPMPLTAIVVSAKLRLFYDSAWAGAATIKVERLATQLTASRATWNTKPDVVSSGAFSTFNAPAGPAGTMIEIDVTSMMAAVANKSAWYGFRVSTTAAGRWLTSAEGTSTQRPQLWVKWSEAPHAPTNLTPDGNDAASKSKPVVRFQVLDLLGDTTIAAVNIRTAHDAANTSGRWDSGWITSDDAEIDLATTTFPAMAPGDSVYWWVRVKDGAGLISDWSDDAQMSYQPKGTLIIGNPAPAVPPDPAYINDPTAPILWTFSGTQVMWQVQVFGASKSDFPSYMWAELADSGVIASQENEWTIPKGVIKKTGANYPYIVEVSVWDNVDRDPWDAATVQSRQFIYTHDPATPGVSGLVASQANPWPSVRLDWTRGTAPDGWVIERSDDGGTDYDVLDTIDVDEAFVSGQQYTFEDDTAQSWRSHKWKVKALVNGKTSDSAIVTWTPTLRGIWLMDKGRRNSSWPNGLQVWIAGAEDGTFTEPEDATTIAPLGSRRSVRRVQQVRNYEGNITGQLVTAFGRSYASYENALLAMRNQPTRPVTLALADMTLRVLIGNIQLAPTATHVPPNVLVSFDFWEV